MAYSNTEIKPVTSPPQAQAPNVKEYQTPADATAIKPTIDTSNTGYQAPTTQFNTHNIDQGLLNYNPQASKNLTFDGRAINANAITHSLDNVTPDFAKSDQFLTDGAFVENRLHGLLEDPNNQLMQRARAQGMEEAGARGLRNTSMGATIGQANMIDKALQVATPDASTQATADMNRQGATYAAQQKQQDAINQGTLAEQAARINSELAAQQAGHSWDSTQQKAAIQGDLNTQAANIEAAKATQQAQYAHDSREHQGLLEGAAQEQQANIKAELAGMESVSAQNLAILQDKLAAAGKTTEAENQAIMQAFSEQQQTIRTELSAKYSAAVSQAQLNASQRDSLANVMTTMANNYEITIQNILLDPNLDAEAKNAAISRINSIFNQDMNNIANVFGASYQDTSA